jgi:SAM-dependent methyltransferase
MRVIASAFSVWSRHLPRVDRDNLMTPTSARLSTPRILDAATVRSLVVEVRRKLPKALWTDVPEWIDRDVLHVQLTHVSHGKLIDLGGGYSAVSAALSKLGMDVTVVDTFESTRFYEQFSADELRKVLESYGVKLIKADLTQHDPSAVFGAESVDTIACFGTIYFFNPRQLLERCMRALKPGGNLIIEFNNAVSFLRRLRVLTGRNNAGSFHEYFLDDVHKRFWLESDIRALASHLKLSEYRLLGRNWSLYGSRRAVPRSALALADNTLRFLPGFCNDIYLAGKKDGNNSSTP